MCRFPIIMTCMFLFFSGCATAAMKAEDKKVPEKKETATLEIPPEPPKTEGSLWSEYNSQGFLYGDIKARQVGDIVTIQINENASGTKDASTKTQKDASISAGIEEFFGLPVGNRNIGASTKNEFSGEGNTSRSGRLTASVTATITRVLPNGNLIISGERAVLINDEEQQIKITGTIRPEDIDSSNFIRSSRIANANIEYTGKGIFEDRQKPGWGTRIIDLIWPF